MRTSSSSLLSMFLGVVLTRCHSEPSTAPVSTVQDQASVVGSSNNWSFIVPWGENNEFETLVSDPSTPYQDVKLMSVESQTASYTAIIPVKKTSNGMLSLRVELNPRKHSIEKLTLLHARQYQMQAIKQIGNGVGHFNAINQRYYVNVACQEILELPDRLNYSSDLQEINCWVSTENNTAAIQYVKL